jgi:hypothetical protein
MVIRDFHVKRIAALKTEAQTPLIVDADTPYVYECQERCMAQLPRDNSGKASILWR